MYWIRVKRRIGSTERILVADKVDLRLFDLITQKMNGKRRYGKSVPEGILVQRLCD